MKKIVVWVICAFVTFVQLEAKTASEIADLKRRGRKGDPKAQTELGQCYEHGIGIEENMYLAVKCYRLAAEAGYARAQFYLGRCYFEGNGVVLDTVKAVQWYRKAAEKGDTEAQFHLGMCYEEGCGITKDGFQAIKWYRAAAEKGFAKAQEKVDLYDHPEKDFFKNTNEITSDASISPNALRLLPESIEGLKNAGLENIFYELGMENVKKANRLMPLVAKKVAQNEECDVIQSVDLSLYRSTQEELVFIVWAKNRKKFYVSENELDGKTSIQSEQEKLTDLLKTHEILAEEVIKTKLQFPSTYRRPLFGIFKSRTTLNGNEIIIEFSAKNAFNLKITYIAVVSFDSNSKVQSCHIKEKE